MRKRLTNEESERAARQPVPGATRGLAQVQDSQRAVRQVGGGEQSRTTACWPPNCCTFDRRSSCEPARVHLERLAPARRLKRCATGLERTPSKLEQKVGRGGHRRTLSHPAPFRSVKSPRRSKEPFEERASSRSEQKEGKRGSRDRSLRRQLGVIGLRSPRLDPSAWEMATACLHVQRLLAASSAQGRIRPSFLASRCRRGSSPASAAALQQAHVRPPPVHQDGHSLHSPLSNSPPRRPHAVRIGWTVRLLAPALASGCAVLLIVRSKIIVRSGW